MEGNRTVEVYEHLMKLIEEKEEIDEDEVNLCANDLLDDEYVHEDFEDGDFDEIDDIIEESALKKKIKQLKLNDSDQDSDDNLLQEVGLESKEEPEASGKRDSLALLESAIQNNRKLKRMLERLECFLILKLRSLDLREEDTEEANECSNSTEGDFYSHFASPYFRDGMFPCPANFDQRMKEKCKPCLYVNNGMHESWDCSSVTSLDHTIRDLLVNEYTTKENGSCVVKGEEHLSAVNKIHALRNRPLDDILKELNVVNLDWEKVSNSMKYPHSPDDCESLWNIFLNPSINKSPWTSEEDSALLRIAKVHKFHNWEVIAKELNTGRSGYLCFTHYQRNLAIKTVKWSNDELGLLHEIFDACKVGDNINWVKLMYYYDCCDFNHLYHKLYKSYNTDFEFPKKGKFNYREDKFIMHAVKKQGLSAHMVSRLLPSRSSTQIRERLRMLDFNDRKLGGWSEQEDMKLIELLKKHGCRNWALIAKEMEHRTRCQVRQHYEHIMKVLRKNPNRSFEYYRSRKAIAKEKGRGKRMFKMAPKECKSVLNVTNLNKEDAALLKYFAHERKIFEMRQSIFNTFELNREEILTMCKLLGIKCPPHATLTKVENKPWKEYIHETFKFFYKNKNELLSINSLDDTITLMPPNTASFNVLRNILRRLSQEKNQILCHDELSSFKDSSSFNDALNIWYKRLMVLFGSSLLLKGVTKPELDGYLTGNSYPKQNLVEE